MSEGTDNRWRFTVDEMPGEEEFRQPHWIIDDGRLRFGIYGGDRGWQCAPGVISGGPSVAAWRPARDDLPELPEGASVDPFREEAIAARDADRAAYARRTAPIFPRRARMA